MKSVKYLDDLMKSEKLKNDAELARYLEWPTSKISQYRTGKRFMDNEACLAIALKLGIDPLKIIMAADIDRAARSGQHSLWEVFTQRTGFAASVLAALLATNFLSPQHAEAASRLAPQQNQESGVKLMSNRRRKLVSALGDALKTIFASTALPATR